jgi:predicted nucleotidyltransferase
VTVFKALERERLLACLGEWVAEMRQRHPEIVSVGLFGSYARGDYGPGSDADVVVLVRCCDEPRWFLRPLEYDTYHLPVGVDLFVYTEAEAESLRAESKWFERILSETVWL